MADDADTPMATRLEMFNTAIQNVITETGLDYLLTRWVLVTDVLDEDGDRHMYTAWPQGTTTWEATGLLQQALFDTQADNVKSFLEAED